MGLRKTTKIRTELPCLVKQKLRAATATSDFLVGKHEWAISKGGYCFPYPSLFPHDIERAEGIALRTPSSMDGRDDMKTPTTGSGSKLDPTRKKPKTRHKGEQAS
ncbi:UNVERIFIED_CONTAM: hypothetical protein Sindi_0466800 [Sesamum indicum]